MRYPNAVHLSLQGKGGIGKSLVASILAQYFLERGQKVRCFDADPVNHTLAQYAKLPVERVKLLGDGGVDPRGFDALLEEVLMTEHGIIVVDSGASTFIPLWNYILENDVVGTLKEIETQLYVHSIVTGGQALGDTLKGLCEVAETATDRNIIVWINEYFGPISYGGKEFLEMSAYKDHADKVLGTITIRRRSPDTFGRDMHEMITRKQTFDEAMESESCFMMNRKRLHIVQDDLFNQLDRLAFIEVAQP